MASCTVLLRRMLYHMNASSNTTFVSFPANVRYATDVRHSAQSQPGRALLVNIRPSLGGTGYKE